MRLIAILIGAILTGCGTVSAKDYTDMAIRAASLEGQIESAKTASKLDEMQNQRAKEALEQWFTQWQMIEGRRAHRPQ